MKRYRIIGSADATIKANSTVEAMRKYHEDENVFFALFSFGFAVVLAAGELWSKMLAVIAFLFGAYLVLKRHEIRLSKDIRAVEVSS